MKFPANLLLRASALVLCLMLNIPAASAGKEICFGGPTNKWVRVTITVGGERNPTETIEVCYTEKRWKDASSVSDSIATLVAGMVVGQTGEDLETTVKFVHKDIDDIMTTHNGTFHRRGLYYVDVEYLMKGVSQSSQQVVRW